MFSSRDTGSRFEQAAAKHLSKHGLSLVDKNFHSRRGEIDLIMRDADLIVFVEVRYRRSAKFGSAAESVNSQKRQRIIATAEHYIQQQQPKCNGYRFDVVAFEGEDLSQCDWIKNAFQLS